jgi:hypothetical protein
VRQRDGCLLTAMKLWFLLAVVLPAAIILALFLVMA